MEFSPLSNGAANVARAASGHLPRGTPPSTLSSWGARGGIIEVYDGDAAAQGAARGAASVCGAGPQLVPHAWAYDACGRQPAAEVYERNGIADAITRKRSK